MSTTFAYRGLDNAGKTVRGEVSAEDRQSAMTLLKSRAVFPIEVTRPGARETGDGERRAQRGSVVQS